MSDQKPGAGAPARIDNPLPPPVPGRRTEPEFPIMDTGDGEWPELAGGTNLDDFDIRLPGQADDFDVSVTDTDDFDL